MTQGSRRTFLKFATAAAAATSPLVMRSASEPLHIGVTDWNLYLGAQPAAVALAAQLGFSGVQISFGRKLAGRKMPADNPETIERYRQQSQHYGIPIDGTCVDRLHDDGLKNGGQAMQWVHDSIRLTKALDVRVLLLPFFGRQAITNDAERDRVGDILRELAPAAEKADVVLGVEDTISAKDNVRIMDLSRSPNVLVYYDVGNSTENGFDVVKEIRWLGGARICQIHLKDNPHMLGEGSIQFEPVVRAIRDSGFSGYANLETDVAKSDVDTGLQRNLIYIRKVAARVYSA